MCGLKVEEDVVLELEEDGFLIESLVRSEDDGPTNIDDDEACEARAEVVEAVVAALVFALPPRL